MQIPAMIEEINPNSEITLTSERKAACGSELGDGTSGGGTLNLIGGILQFKRNKGENVKCP
jgi:hypothetical protein